MDHKAIPKASSEDLIRALLRGQPSQADSQADLQVMCAELGARIDGGGKNRRPAAKSPAKPAKKDSTDVNPTKSHEH